jgi:phosphohistidine phosphatase
MLLRHAKSEWPDVPDHERPLAKRGRRDAPRVGRWLRDHGYLPDVVVCSSARRARETWELAAAQLGASPVVRFEPRAYDVGALSLLYLLRELPGSCRAALLIGHNPAIEDLAESLAGPPAEPQAGQARQAAPAPQVGQAAPARQDLRFPTAAVAVFEFTGDWPRLTPGRARLLAFTAPADL